MALSRWGMGILSLAYVHSKSPVQPPMHVRGGSRLASEGLAVFAEVLQRTFDNAPDLLLQAIDILAIFRQSHPTKLDRLADGLVHLGRSEKVRELVWVRCS